jgi:hypothetical protein
MNKGHLIREGDIFEIGDSRYIVISAKEGLAGDEIVSTEAIKFKKTGSEGENLMSPSELYRSKFIGNIMEI